MGRAEPTPGTELVRARGLATVAGTLLFISIELVLLTVIYLRGSAFTDQRLAVARYQGAIAAPTPATAASGIGAANAAAVPAGNSARIMNATSQLLHDFGKDRARLGPLNLAAASASGAPSPTDLPARAEQLARELAADQQRTDRQTSYLYVALLVVVSIGWMFWFRRLVTRHRKLQNEISEQRERSLSEHRLAALVRNSSDVVIICDEESTILFATPSAVAVLGVQVVDLVGAPLINWVHAEEVDRFAVLVAGQRSEDQALTMRICRADGQIVNIEGNVTNMLSDSSVAGLVVTLRDVTERVALEEQLRDRAFVDPLTRLANRQLFADRLEHAMSHRSGIEAPLVVLLCDLDDFKNVNDSLGHGIGDSILEIVGDRVREVIRQGDTAARLGGDEFAILMEGTDLAGADLVARRLQSCLAEPIAVPNSGPITVRCSIGLARAVPGEMSGEDALRNADVAMYLAKNRGKSGIAVYESRLHTEALERLELRAELQRALLNREELVLFYQPSIVLETGEVAGFEALVRWNHPVRGFLPPAMFIPLAEESGLIAPLGTWVLNEACRAAALLQTGGRRPTMAVNVASEQLAQPGFAATVLQALADSGLDPDRLTLEITESVILDDLAEITPRLAGLRQQGIRIAIDDFGTGYSSLAYLTHLPLDVLKVDKSFVDRVVLDGQDASVTAAIIAMGRAMQMDIVAEGVEDAGQATWLRSAQCHYGQGYLWSRPVPLERAMELVVKTFVVPSPVTGPPSSVSNKRVASPERASF